MHIFCDNQAVISFAKNPIHHDRTKHTELDRHFIKGIFELTHTPTSLQVVDIFIEALPRVKFEDLISKLGMIDIYSPAWGGV